MNLNDTPKKISLYFSEGSSDKEYHAQIVARGDGYIVEFAYGRRGSTLTTGTKTADPVPLEKAVKVFEKLIAEKKAKGYTENTSGAVYAGSDKAGAVSGVLPQLLNPIDEVDVDAYLRDDRYALQEKMDGKRIMLRKADGVIDAINRKGLVVSHPRAWGDALAAHRSQSLILDGEGVGDRFFAFDVLCVDGVDATRLPFSKRLDMLYALSREIVDPSIQFVPAYLDQSEKRRVLASLRALNAEGVVFKDVNAPYTAGRPNSGGPQLKLKFVEESTCIVLRRNGDKRSVALGMRDDAGSVVEVGSVTIPPNFDVPAAGALVEVRYLYKFAAGMLFQPVYRGERDDLDVSAASLAQVKRVKDAATEDDDA